MIAGNTGNVVCNTSFTDLSDTLMVRLRASAMFLMDSSAPAGPEHAGEVRVVEGDQPQVLVHVRALVLLGLHGVEELQKLSHVGLGDLRFHPALRDPRVKAFLDGLQVNQDRPQRGYNSSFVRTPWAYAFPTRQSQLGLQAPQRFLPERNRLQHALNGNPVRAFAFFRTSVGKRGLLTLSVEGVFQMAYIVPERLLTLVRPAFDVVLRRIRSLKRCVEA